MTGDIVTRLRKLFRRVNNYQVLKKQGAKRGIRHTFIVIDDGFGNAWEKCGRADCDLHVVRPGKTQCDTERCPIYE